MSLVGRTIGRYRITQELGEGGMGVVYRAQDSTLERDVAIKLLRAEAGQHPERVRRFSQEARAASALNHPNIITVYDAGEFEGGPFIVMELVEGEALRAQLQRGAMPLAVVLDIGIQAATALARAHDAGITHRDLKPENILLRPDGYVKILDFGLAKLKEKEPLDSASAATTLDGALTSEGAIVGTAAYMSPEQGTGRQVDGRSDIFSLTLVLYECWQGRHPFLRDNMLDTLHAIAHDRLPTLSYPAGSPEWGLARMLEKALEKEPDERYQTMKDLGIDLRRLRQESESGKLPSSAAAALAPRRRPWAYVAVAAVALAAAAASLLWLRSGSKPAGRSEWVQLTHFPDSVVQPALSPDGRMLAFVRGPRSQLPTRGQIYIKMLPDGEPKQLTQDDLPKMSPVFSPDGTRIAYSTVDTKNEWDTWLVSALGGESRDWLPNASGLAWVAKQRLVFSEKIRNSQGNHMKIVTADESRAGARDVYVPMPRGAMAHRSFPSPDGNWTLAAEMDDRGAWLPCRLIPMDGSSSSGPVGPPGPCWYAAWSPDGKWIYVSANHGDGFHIWRQRFSASGARGEPEQITSGPTQEEGVAVAPDGRSFVTAVGLNQSSVWVHDPKGDRQVSLEGHAYQPKFAPDGRKLIYAVLKSGSPERSELWTADISSGLNEPLLPGFPIAETALGGAYDISVDGRQVVMQAVDREGKNRLWLAPLDRRSPPRQIPNVEGDGPLFAPNGEVLFRAREGAYGFAYRVRADGTGLRKVSEHPVIETEGVSPDGKWLMAYARPNEESAGGTLALPLDGGPPVQIYGTSLRAKWSPDGRLLFLMMHNATHVVPLPPGRMLPAMPAGGFKSEQEIANLPGGRVIDNGDVAPGLSRDVYAFSRETVQRNLYRIPLP